MFVATEVHLVPGFPEVRLVGVPVKAAFADASVQEPAATYVFVVVRFINADVSETATNPAPVPDKAP